VRALKFRQISHDDPLQRALAKVGELYTATNFLTWWDGRAFDVDGEDALIWDPGERDHEEVLASFVEGSILRSLPAAGAFRDHVARVGRVGWSAVRDGILDALRHHPTAGGARPGTAASTFSPHAFMLLDILEDQVAAALGFSNGRALGDCGPEHLRCARLRPAHQSAFGGTLYQHLFVIYAPGSRRLLWFDLGGSG
jgi:hypothetical protein